MKKSRFKLPLMAVFLLSISFSSAIAQAEDSVIPITKAKAIDNTKVELQFSNNKKLLLDFYGDNIFRLFQDNSGEPMRDPKAEPHAKILLDNPRKAVDGITVSDKSSEVLISTSKILVNFDKKTTRFTVTNLQTGKQIIQTKAPITFDKNKVQIILNENFTEYFYGGGVQNGRFSHKGKSIAIENQNSWTDGGVASPTPFYWSTGGYAFMWHTFKKGVYDFGTKEKNSVKLTHDTDYLDVFFMVNDGVVSLLNDFYQLTGKPVLIPKFGFYQGHLNAYNRDYWKEDAAGVLFEDGKRYKESQKDNGGTKESLNGEKNNYMFSARAVVDRYKNHDMPLGWILPNDGYGAGYGQTSTLEGNIQNLKEFGDYARKNGVEIGLWTQSDLHPKDGIEPLLQRDIINEVGVAGVRVLKTDVAWVGAGYSFGLNGVQDVATIMPKYGNQARPFIISLDGWAGTQHYATIWSGDQTGGQWEYIRFHIPTYIGSGLSGQPNICSDMDGIFGGKNVPVNVRDFQWKTFTLMQLNMDGWGSNEKYPHALGEPATSINRHYLKLKSELLPYAYSVAHESVAGLPSIRAMFLEEENSYTLGKNTQYQYMYGPSFLVAPIYQNTNADKHGNDVRNGIYLPKGSWVDYFSGQLYEGGRIINNQECPIWKIPVFVKNGAIIPMVNPNNNLSEIDKNHRIYEVYPFGNSSFTEYDDDGVTMSYLEGESAQTVVNSSVSNGNIATVNVMPTKGSFKGFVNEKSTEIKINVSRKPTKVSAKVGNKSVKLKEVKTLKDFEVGVNVYFYDASPNLNRFATKDSSFASVKMVKNPQVLVKVGKTDISKKGVSVSVKGFEFKPACELLRNGGVLAKLQNLAILDSNATAYTLKPSWSKLANADFYELELDGMLYSTVKDNSLLFENLTPETRYEFKVRAVNNDGKSEWTNIAATTKADPLQFAIRGITGESSAAMQGGEAVRRLLDFDEGNMMHSKYGEKAVPFDMIFDLNSINQLDKLVYLPRLSGKNGMLEKGKVYFSNDKSNWTEAGTYDWKTDFENKTFTFTAQPVARYVKISVEKAVGDYGSGRELYIFKVPGSESYLPGDINNDKLVDSNDLTSYLNYTGLRFGDGDFEGYVSRGDVNKNNLIDAYDISNVAIRLEGGVNVEKNDTLAGMITLETVKLNYKQGETVDVIVKAKGLKAVNALSFALPYDVKDYDFVAVKQLKMKSMQNFTNDRLHTNGEKVLYPAFINIGEKEALMGDGELFVIQLKAKRAVKFNLKPKHGMLVDKQLKTIAF